jgi:hypothetical protein
VLGVVFVVPWHFVELESSCFSLGIGIRLCEVAISSISMAGSFIENSSFVKSLYKGDLSLFLVEELRRIGEIFHISAFIVMSSGLVGISLEQRSVLKLIESAHKTNELLSVYARDKGAFIGVFVLFGDETHREDKSVPVFMVFILSSYEGKNIVEAWLVESKLRDGKVETMDRSTNNLD